MLPGKDGQRVLELYVAGDTLNSRRARENLDVIVQQLDEPTAVTVVDVVKSPKEALARRIFATPSLISINGGQKVLIIGDLADREAVLQRLRGS